MTLSVAIHTYDDLVTPVAALSDTFDRAIDIEKNDAGTGTFSILTSNANLSACQHGRIAMVTDSVSSTRIGFVIEHQRRKVLDIGGAAEQVAVISGRLLPALLERAVVYPEGGANAGQTQDVRVFNYANPAFDDSSWTSLPALVKQGTNPNASSKWAPPSHAELLPRNWEDPDAYWMGPGTWEDAPDGHWMFRWTFTIASASTYLLDYAVDNASSLYIDGVLIGGRGGFIDKYEVELELSAGTHVIAGRVGNPAQLDDNPTAFLGTLWSLSQGERAAVVHRTTAASDIVALTTPTVSGGAKGVKFKIPIPGMTVGETLDLLLSEAQERGALAGWTWTFDADVDSAAVAWPGPAEVSLRVGDDLLTVLRQLAQTYIDFKVDYDDLVLHVYAKGGLGSASGVSYTSGVSVSELEVEAEG